MTNKLTNLISIVSVTILLVVWSVFVCGDVKACELGGRRIYEVNHRVDLRGDTVTLPHNIVLKFKRDGHIANGIVVGDNTQILGNTKDIFDSVELLGSWIVENISTDMFKGEDRYLLKNLSNLSSDDIYNLITVNRDCYAHIIPFSSEFVIKSNTDLLLNANIYSAKTFHKGGYCIYINGSNIKLKGNGHKVVGEIEIHQGPKGQWLHAICIGAESSNVIIDNFVLEKFCGDGIAVQGTQINISRVICDSNGRQGVSIVHGRDISISNSIFINTGRLGINESGGPGAGVDIEPTNDPVRDVLIENCSFENNYKYYKDYINDLEIFNAKDVNCIVRNCTFENLYIGSSSDVLVENCSIDGIILGIDRDVHNIRFVNSGHPKVSLNLKGKLKFL